MFAYEVPAFAMYKQHIYVTTPPFSGPACIWGWHRFGSALLPSQRSLKCSPEAAQFDTEANLEKKQMMWKNALHSMSLALLSKAGYHPVHLAAVLIPQCAGGWRALDLSASLCSDFEALPVPMTEDVNLYIDAVDVMRCKSVSAGWSRPAVLYHDNSRVLFLWKDQSSSHNRFGNGHFYKKLLQ